MVAHSLMPGLSACLHEWTAHRLAEPAFELKTTATHFGSFAPQVMTVWLGTFLVGSFFSQFHQWLDNPSSAVNLLGTAVPQTASFFLTYLALSAFWTVPFGGLGIIGLLIYWVKGKIAATEAARARLWQEQYAKYGADVRPDISPV